MMSSAHVLIFIRFYCIPFGALQPTFLRNNESIFPRQRLVCPLHCTLCLSLLGIISDHLVIVKMSCLSICAWFWTLLSKKVKKIYIFSVTQYFILFSQARAYYLCCAVHPKKSWKIKYKHYLTFLRVSTFRMYKCRKTRNVTPRVGAEGIQLDFVFGPQPLLTFERPGVEWFAKC